MPFILVLEACQRKNGEKPNILISKSLPVIVINLMYIYTSIYMFVWVQMFIYLLKITYSSMKVSVSKMATNHGRLLQLPNRCCCVINDL